MEKLMRAVRIGTVAGTGFLSGLTYSAHLEAKRSLETALVPMYRDIYGTEPSSADLARFIKEAREQEYIGRMEANPDVPVDPSEAYQYDW